METNKVTVSGSAIEQVKWAINEIAYDMQAKEHVKITNLRCPLCARGDTSHQRIGVECATEPFEASAIRFIGFNQSKPQLAFTIRSVDPTKLRKTSITAPYFEMLAQNPTGQNYEFLGRL